MASYSTIGSLIRDKRTRLGLTQSDLALAIGYRSIDRLGEIEAGKAALDKSTDRSTLSSIFDVLHLTAEERGQALLLAGQPPSREEQDQAIKSVAEYLDTWPYPAYMLDFRWALIYPNEEALTFFHLSKDHPIVRNRDNVLKLVLDEGSPIYSKPGQDKRWDNFLKLQIAMFKEEQFHRTTERWFLEVWRELSQYPVFRETWKSLDDLTIMKFARLRRLKSHSPMRFPGWMGDPQRRYHISSAPVDVDERFKVKLFFKLSNSVQLCDDNQRLEQASSI